LLIDPKANRIRGVAKLNKKDARSQTGLFLLEGLQGLKEALDRPKLIREIFTTSEAIAANPSLFAKASAARIEVVEVNEAVLGVISDTRTPQGVVAVCEQLHVGLDDVLATEPKIIALLSNIRDPGNAGTVLRAADAAGADAVIFSENSVDVYNPKVVRSTTGSLFHLPVVLGANLETAVASAKRAGFQVFAATAGGASLPELEPSILSKPTVWMFGNEAWGFEPAELALADMQVGVPIYGAAESLNLATAASICLYATAFAQNR
jgi:TrmH family RNA methyltransferase